MALPFKVKSLDDVPEAQRALYKKGDDGFTLDVEGVETEESVSGLKSALAKTKRELGELRERAGKISDKDLEELETLRAAAAAADEAKAREAGKFDELRTKLQEKHDKDLTALRTQLETRDKVIERLTVTNEIMSALDAAGVLPEYKRAAFLDLKERGPKVKWAEDGNPAGIFSDEVEGDQPIPAFVAAWAKSDAASPYMPPENGSGGGAGGEKVKGGKTPSWEGKKYSDMTPDEKIEYTQAQYEKGAYQPSAGAAA